MRRIYPIRSLNLIFLLQNLPIFKNKKEFNLFKFSFKFLLKQTQTNFNFNLNKSIKYQNLQKLNKTHKNHPSLASLNIIIKYFSSSKTLTHRTV